MLSSLYRKYFAYGFNSYIITYFDQYKKNLNYLRTDDAPRSGASVRTIVLLF